MHNHANRKRITNFQKSVYLLLLTLVVLAAGCSGKSPKITYTMRVEGAGTISPSPGSYRVPSRTTVELLAAPAKGWVFEQWHATNTTYEYSRGSDNDALKSMYSPESSVFLNWAEEMEVLAVFKPVLTMAVINEDIDEVKKLLESGVNPDIPDALGNTALHAAAEKYRCLHLGELLISHGANVNLRNKNGETPLDVHLARGYGLDGAKNFVELLLNSGAQINYMNSSGSTPLHAAASFSSPILKLLISYGADVNAVDHNGDTPLHVAIKSNKNIAPLVEGGARVNIPDQNGYLPLYMTVSKEALISTRLLLEHGADVNARNSGGTTRYALLAAASTSNGQLTKLLLEYGADTNLRNDEGWSALDIAANSLRQGYQQHYPAVVQVLIENGMDPCDSIPLFRDIALQNNARWTALTALGGLGPCAVLELLEIIATNYSQDNNHFYVVEAFSPYSAASISAVNSDAEQEVHLKIDVEKKAYLKTVAEFMEATSREVAHTLAGIYRDPSSNLQAQAANVLGVMGTEDGKAVLLEELMNPKSTLRDMAADSLIENKLLTFEHVIKQLEGIVPKADTTSENFGAWQEEYLNELNYAIKLSGRIGEKEAIPFLMTAWANRTYEVRINILEAVLTIGSPDGLPMVEMALENDDPRLRRKAIQTLLAIEPTTMVELLTNHIADSDQEVRKLVVEGLSRMGPPYRYDVKAALKTAANSFDSQISKLAQNALGFQFTVPNDLHVLFLRVGDGSSTEYTFDSYDSKQIGLGPFDSDSTITIPHYIGVAVSKGNSQTYSPGAIFLYFPRDGKEPQSSLFVRHSFVVREHLTIRDNNMVFKGRITGFEDMIYEFSGAKVYSVVEL